MHAISEMSIAGTICLDRGQMDALFSAANSNKSASIEDRSVIYSEYAAYLWLGEKDYAAAREVLVRTTKDNANDVLNRFNLLRLYRFLGDVEGVLGLLNDLQSRNLNRRDSLQFQSIVRDLATDGVSAK
jgi:hypothetical protein